MSLVAMTLNILILPLSVFIKDGVGSTLIVSIILTLIGWIPGVISAFSKNNIF